MRERRAVVKQTLMFMQKRKSDNVDVLIYPWSMLTFQLLVLMLYFFSFFFKTIGGKGMFAKYYKLIDTGKLILRTYLFFFFFFLIKGITFRNMIHN